MLFMELLKLYSGTDFVNWMSFMLLYHICEYGGFIAPLGTLIGTSDRLTNGLMPFSMEGRAAMITTISFKYMYAKTNHTSVIHFQNNQNRCHC